MARDNLPDEKTDAASLAKGYGESHQDQDGALLSAVTETEARAETLLRRDGLATPRRIDGVVIGRLVESTGTGEAIVDYPGNPSDVPLPAVSTVPVGNKDVGRKVALAFVAGDPKRPVLIGVVEGTGSAQGSGDPSRGTDESQSFSVELDGERLTLTAGREIVLRCGKASITLTRAGKVLIRGAYILNRSSGVNRIRGGSVQIN